AEVLKVSPRTIWRDLAEVRRGNAIQRDPGLVDEFVGELVVQARHVITRLRRTARERECPHATRVDAELGVWRVMLELTQWLQRLGLLPTAPQEIRADLTHRVDAPPSFEELESQVQGLELVLQQAGGGDEGARASLESLRDELARHRARERLGLLK